MADMQPQRPSSQPSLDSKEKLLAQLHQVNKKTIEELGMSIPKDSDTDPADSSDQYPTRTSYYADNCFLRVKREITQQIVEARKYDTIKSEIDDSRSSGTYTKEFHFSITDDEFDIVKESSDFKESVINHALRKARKNSSNHSLGESEKATISQEDRPNEFGGPASYLAKKIRLALKRPRSIAVNDGHSQLVASFELHTLEAREPDSRESGISLTVNWEKLYRL